MKNFWQKLSARLDLYHFELKHIVVLLVVLAASQVVVSFVQKLSLRDFLIQTQSWYQRDSAEQIANLTASSLELVLASASRTGWQHLEHRQEIVQSFDIIFSQQLLLQNIEEVCVIVTNGDSAHAIDNGKILYEYFLGSRVVSQPPDMPHEEALRLYHRVHERLTSSEQIQSILEGRQTFHVFVPFIPKGELAGAVYIKNSPDFGHVTRQVIASHNETSFVFMGMTLFGLVAMLYISSHAVRDRDDVQRQLYRTREIQLKDRIDHQKESQFAKRIYHTHHKAEKVMGFIKEDLRTISASNLEAVKYRITKYANFISRVIYDMKWYVPPIQTIRGAIFQTDLNEVIRFIVDNIFLRVARQSSKFTVDLDLDAAMPPVQVNEFVVWEIIEPLLQNCFDHGEGENVAITIRSRYDQNARVSHVTIADNGRGIAPNLLETNEDGTKRIFLENISTKSNAQNAGYGCYLAYEISKERCGWRLNAENLPQGGCQFTLEVDHEK